MDTNPEERSDNHPIVLVRDAQCMIDPEAIARIQSGGEYSPCAWVQGSCTYPSKFNLKKQLRHIEDLVDFETERQELRFNPNDCTKFQCIETGEDIDPEEIMPAVALRYVDGKLNVLAIRKVKDGESISSE